MVGVQSTDLSGYDSPVVMMRTHRRAEAAGAGRQGFPLIGLTETRNIHIVSKVSTGQACMASPRIAHLVNTPGSPAREIT